MAGKAAQIVVTERQETILRQTANAATATVRDAQRARIILDAFQKKFNRDIAVEVGLNRGQVSLSRGRWADSFEAMVAIEHDPGSARKSRRLARRIVRVLNNIEV